MTFGPENFRQQTNVSRETLDRLQAYADLLVKWQARINLVSASTLKDLWMRHMLDGAQLYALLPKDCRVLVDLGSGAGFPGLVLAIMGVPEVHLIESDTRKAVFLKEAARAAGTVIQVHNVRIESAALGPIADVVSARALASVDKLCAYAKPLLKEGGKCLFLKGQKGHEELTDAGKIWNIRSDWTVSQTDPSGAILMIDHFDKK